MFFFLVVWLYVPNVGDLCVVRIARRCYISSPHLFMYLVKWRERCGLNSEFGMTACGCVRICVCIDVRVRTCTCVCFGV